MDGVERTEAEGDSACQGWTLIFAAGDSACTSRDDLVLDGREPSLVVCADAGLLHCLNLGFRADAVVGDFDSADPAWLRNARDSGARVFRHPCDKDETDLDLALSLACRMSGQAIVVTGLTGGRIDHTLGNLDVCQHYARTGHSVRAREAWGEAVFLVGQSAVEFYGVEGDIVSLLPRGCGATGVLTTGLKYPLDREALLLGSSRGISNVMQGQCAKVEIDGGELLAIHLTGQC